ncbi:lysozyme [Paenibacillus taichungensis]|uniref:lysozyme n=1 Tax=Paenibacillus taichungensis TaxID=484184 RepID=UPI003D9A0CDD
MGSKISQVGINLIKSFEGCRLKAYKPVPTETYYTIGWGHYGPDVREGMTITQEKADSMLVADLANYEGDVNNPSYVPVIAQLNQNQFDTLVSFTYNCGNGSLRQLCKGRTIARKLSYLATYSAGLPALARIKEAEY